MDKVTHISGGTSQYCGILNILGRAAEGLGGKQKKGRFSCQCTCPKERDMDPAVHPTAQAAVHSALNRSPRSPQPQPSPSHRGRSTRCSQPLHPPASLTGQHSSCCGTSALRDEQKQNQPSSGLGSSSSPRPEPTVGARRAGKEQHWGTALLDSNTGISSA